VQTSLTDIKTWKADVRDNDPGALAFGQELGFGVRSHDFESRIDLTQFDIGSFQSYVDSLKASGLTVTTVGELGDDESARYRLYEIEHITDHDIPNVNMEDLPTWEDAQRIMFTASYYDPSGEFVALDGDRFVGLSGVAELTPGNFYNQHTCGLREYRRRGIALALKALALDYAKKRGGKTCRTNNNEENEPMLAINQRFGFVAQPGLYELQRSLE
jgi:RimJ/RimL family protein N-acetyltransferase